MANDPNKDQLTKKDPEEEIKKWVDYQNSMDQDIDEDDSQGYDLKLDNFDRQRRFSLTWKLSLLLGVTSILVICLLYYISPLADVNTVRVNKDSPIDQALVLDSSNVHLGDKVIWTLAKKNQIKDDIMDHFPSVKNVEVKLSGINNIDFKISERQTVGYEKVNDGYRRIIEGGKISPELIKKAPDKWVFIGYSKEKYVLEDIKLLQSIDASFRTHVKTVNGAGYNDSEIVFIMDDGNIVIGDRDTIKNKVKYYDQIKKDTQGQIVVDLEVGAFSRPQDQSDQKKYNLAN